MVTPQLVYDIINEEVPFSRQENWDNSGLLINTGKKSEKVLVCLDVTEDVILKAEEAEAKIWNRLVGYTALMLTNLLNSLTLILQVDL